RAAAVLNDAREGAAVIGGPTVSVTEPATLLVTLPLPLRAPMVSLWSSRSSVALSVTSDVLGMAFATPTRRVPALTVVAPE
ncbi:MAG: hypothetical protein WB562_13505, partial [Candidatus Sulfotelmatobacter sp.]